MKEIYMLKTNSLCEVYLHKALGNLITKIESLKLILTCENDAQTGIYYQNSARKSTIRILNLRQPAVVQQVGFYFLNLPRHFQS